MPTISKRQALLSNHSLRFRGGGGGGGYEQTRPPTATCFGPLPRSHAPFPRYVAEVGELAHEHGLPLHIDGARIWNAAAALDSSLATVAAPADR